VPATGQLLEPSLVQVSQQLADRRVELGQAEEAPVAQPGQNPAFDDLNPDFDLRLRVSPELPVVQRLKRP